MSSPFTHKAIVLFSCKPFLLQTTPLLRYLMENDSIYSAAMPQSLPSRLSSTLYGFLVFSPHLLLTICPLSTKGRLCQTIPIASFDKIADFLVKGNALDTIYLDFSNAFDMVALQNL